MAEKIGSSISNLAARGR